MSNQEQSSDSRSLNRLIQEQSAEISQLTAIGKAIGEGKETSHILEMILTTAMRFSKADGGTLYLVDRRKQSLNFHVILNRSLNIQQSDHKIHLPAVPLYTEKSTPNLSNVSSHVYHTGETINIQNVYHSDRFHFHGTMPFDEKLGYESRSMLVIPMRDHENRIIGILQLINAIDPVSGAVTAFTFNDQDKAEALASHAAILLTQQQLIHEMKALFEAFIKAIAVSIDEKSKHTSGHIQRVAKLSCMIAREINRDDTLFNDVSFTSDQMDELRIAALMHDTGKITTPDHIIDKSSKLSAVMDRIELLGTRWELFKTNQKLAAAEKKLAILDQEPYRHSFAEIDAECNGQIHQLEAEFDTLSAINASHDKLNQNLMDQLKKISEKSGWINGKQSSYLNDDEYKHLSIARGNLTHEERDIIGSHADLSRRILNKLPWPEKLANIPAIAGSHHEKLDGSGYPLKLTEENLNIQARILAIADIFEALCARDRPYKQAKTLGQAVKILEKMGRKNQLDPDIITLFVQSGIHIVYANKYLDPWQLDLSTK